MHARPLAASLLLALASPSVAAANAPAAAFKPPPPDTRAGHVYVAPSIGLAKAMGSAEASASMSQIAATGTTLGGDVGYGISRYVVAIGSFQSFSLGAADQCPGCKTTGWAAGAGLQYHLIEGSPFDPWVSYELGWRSTQIAPGVGPSTTYAGLEWARIAFGGDWYPTPLVGIGPYLELDIGTYGSRSPGSIAESSTHTFLSSGLRIVLDPLR